MRQTGSAAPRLLLAGLIIIGAGAAGFLAFRQTRAPETPALAPAADAATSTEIPSGDPSAVNETAPARKAVPDTLPDITLDDLEGKPTALASFAGRPLMVNFWATWCAPCRREIPLLNRLSRERAAQNAKIVGIAVDFRDKVIEFTKQVPLEYPLLIGEEDGLAAADAFGMGMAFPFSVFIDSQNRILTVKIGELHEDEANFAFDRLRDIDQGVLTRKAAQKAIADAFREMSAARARQEAEKPEAHAN